MFFVLLALISCSVVFGNELNALNEEGQTSLMSAANSGQIDVIDTLVGQGAEVDFADPDGWTALIWAR